MKKFKVLKKRGYPQEFKEEMFETKEEALSNMRDEKEEWNKQFLFELDDFGGIEFIIWRM